MKYLYCLPCNFVNRHVQSICNSVKLRASVVVYIMEFTAHPPACQILFGQDGKQEINLEWPNGSPNLSLSAELPGVCSPVRL